MKELPATVRDCVLSKGFTMSYYSRYRADRLVDTSIHTNPLYHKAIILNFTEDEEVFVPSFIFGDIAEILDRAYIKNEERTEAFLDYLHSTTFIKSFWEERYAEVKTSSAVIIAALGTIGSTFTKIKFKDKNYLGGNGLLLEEDGTPLLMYGHKLKLDTLEDRIYYSEPTVYINPSILIDTDPLSKYIKTNILPVLATKQVFNFSASSLSSNYSLMHLVCNNLEEKTSINVVIRDMSHLIYYPEEPKSIDYQQQIQENLIKRLDNDN